MRRRAFGLRPCRLCRHGHSASIPRACGAARFACLQGIGLATHPRRAMLGAPATRRTGLCRIGQASAPPQRPRRGAYAVASCDRLCECVPPSTLAVLVYRITKDGVTDTPLDLAMKLPRHASRSASQGAAGAFSSVVEILTWPGSGREPVKAACGDAESAITPFGADRPKASLSRCESWRWRGCASGFMAATVQRKQFPLLCHCVRRICVFRKSVTGVFGIVTDGFGNVTGDFGDVTEASSSAC